MERHDTLLIACSSGENRKHLRSVLEQRYNVLEAVNASQTVLLLRQNIACICAVLVDSSLRDIPDKTVLLEPQVHALLDRVPVIVISPDDPTAEELSIFFRYGASDVIPLHYDPYAMTRRIETIAELQLHKQNLEAIVQQQADVLLHSSDSMVDALSAIIEYRSAESGNHTLRVRCFTRILMEEVMRCCPEYGLSDRLVTIIASASVLHDIGKIAIPDAILMKPGKLTAQEWETMKTHALTGCHILDDLRGTVDAEYLRYAHNICHYHHERWDGSGYPEGLRGDDIPICAQVVGLADAYDALTSNRVYKSSYSFVEAVNMILKGECGAFSPKLLECFKNVTERFEALTREYADGRSPEDAPFDMSLPTPDRHQDNTLAHTRAMYYSLVHYMGVFLVEVDLDQHIFQVIYNPYPELAQFQDVSTLAELQSLMLDKIVIPQERERMKQLIWQDIPAFVEADLRRASYLFHYQDQRDGTAGAFEMTLLRPGASDQTRQSVSILCRILKEGELSQKNSLSSTLPVSGYVCRNDRDFTLVRLAEDALELGGYTLEDLMGPLEGRLRQVIYPADREMVRSEFDRQLERGTLVSLEHRVVCKDGTVMWVANKSRLLVDADGREYIYSFLADISLTRAACEALEERIRKYEIILSQTENVLFEWDMIQDTIDFSDTWEQVFGADLRRENIRSLILDNSFFHPDDTPRILDCISALENGSNYEMTEVRIASRRGRYLWCRFRASAGRDDQGKLTKVMGIIINIDAEKQAQRALLDRAERDSLTKLLNKEAARKQAEAYLSQFPDGVRCTMLVIDLDDFKNVNDRYGHLFGDAVLTKTAQAIEKHFQAQDIVARIGGDEFLVLVRGVADKNLLNSRCKSLIDSLRRVFRSIHKQMNLSCSIGAALAPDHGKNYYDLFEHADQALYRAKAKGKNTLCFYDEVGTQSDPKSSFLSTPIDSDLMPGLAEDNLVRATFQKLYAAKDVKGAVDEVIALLGRTMNVSRVYVFENTPDNLFCNNTFEWCNNGISPEIQNLQNISYDRDIPHYQDNFNEQGVFYCPDVAALSPEVYEILEPQGIKSMLQCAIRQEGVFRGYIGFDECVSQRLWTKEEISMLTYFSDVLATFLLKHREQEEHRTQAEELRTILDNQQNWIYITNPDTCQLKYLNRATRLESPGVKPGMLCYQALLGKRERCAGCPALGIRDKKNAWNVLPDEKYPMGILADATMIQWQGEECCLMTCRMLPETENRKG